MRVGDEVGARLRHTQVVSIHDLAGRVDLTARHSVEHHGAHRCPTTNRSILSVAFGSCTMAPEIRLVTVVLTRPTLAPRQVAIVRHTVKFGRFELDHFVALLSEGGTRASHSTISTRIGLPTFSFASPARLSPHAPRTGTVTSGPTGHGACHSASRWT